MNIVWLTPEIPYPPIGGRNGVYNRIVQLSKYNNIYLFSIAYNDEEQNSKKEMEKYCCDVRYYNRGREKLKTYLRSCFMPYSVASRTSKVIKKDISDIMQSNKIDVVITDFPNMAQIIFDIKKKSPELFKNVYCTLNQHNIEYIRMRNMFKIDTISWIKRVAYLAESIRLECYEKSIYEKNIFQSITFFSTDDMSFFEKRWSKIKSKLRCFPLGANKMPLSGVPSEKHTLLFVGRLDEVAITNVEAVLWFKNNVMPKIIDEVPDAVLIVAGANPSERITALESRSIEIIPNYAKAEDVYSKSACVVLPLLSGGGVKGKLLEAASLSKIIISTQHGIEGTSFIPNSDVIFAETAEDFSEACIDVLRNPLKYKEMQERAYRRFIEEYDWIGIGKQYNEFLLENSLRNG